MEGRYKGGLRRKDELSPHRCDFDLHLWQFLPSEVVHANRPPHPRHHRVRLHPRPIRPRLETAVRIDPRILQPQPCVAPQRQQPVRALAKLRRVDVPTLWVQSQELHQRRHAHPRDLDHIIFAAAGLEIIRQPRHVVPPIQVTVGQVLRPIPARQHVEKCNVIRMQAGRFDQRQEHQPGQRDRLPPPTQLQRHEQVQKRQHRQDVPNSDL
jgi:hypothetical protein